MQFCTTYIRKKGTQDHIKIMKENMNITNEDSAIINATKVHLF